MSYAITQESQKYINPKSSLYARILLWSATDATPISLHGS